VQFFGPPCSDIGLRPTYDVKLSRINRHGLIQSAFRSGLPTDVVASVVPGPGDIAVYSPARCLASR